ncbi:MAG: hypothetical protein ACRD5G_04785 [Candidatus Acidiferrales bacterium]
MNSKRTLLFRGFLLATLISSYAYQTYGKEDPSFVPIVRNVAWNDLVAQVQFLPQDSAQDSLDKDLLIIQKFLQAHETEARVGIYDLKVLRAIDKARARLRRADKDLETIQNELSYKEQQARLEE